MVRWLFAKIENDPRHHSVRLLHMAELSGGERQHDVGMRFMLGHVPGYTPSDDDLSSNGTSEASSSDDPASPGVCDVAGPSQDHPWLRLTYASVLSVKTRRVAFNLIGAVVHTAVHNNPRLGIGGVLLLNARTLPYKVVQVLEGPEPAVRALFRTIERDLRHEHCTLIMEERLLTEGQRRFFEWGMRQADFTDWGSLMQTSQSVHGGNLFNSAGAEHLFAPGADAKVALSKLMRWEQEVVVLQAAIEANAPSSALKQAAERRPSRGAKYFADTPGSAPLTAASTALEDHVEELAAAEKNTKQQQIASADVIEEARMAAVLQQQQQLTPLGGGSSIKRRAKVQVAGA